MVQTIDMNRYNMNNYPILNRYWVNEWKKVIDHYDSCAQEQWSWSCMKKQDQVEKLSWEKGEYARAGR